MSFALIMCLAPSQKWSCLALAEFLFLSLTTQSAKSRVFGGFPRLLSVRNSFPNLTESSSGPNLKIVPETVGFSSCAVRTKLTCVRLDDGVEAKAEVTVFSVQVF